MQNAVQTREKYYCECDDPKCPEVLNLTNAQFIRVLEGAGFVRAKTCKSERKGELIEDFGSCEWLDDGEER